jgi:2-oxoglutarate ferredoxin oxidoreductase subunit alpha
MSSSKQSKQELSHTKNQRVKNSQDFSIVLCGAAGQGIKTVESLLAHIFQKAGYYVFSTKEYMSRIRGGVNSTEIRIGSHPVKAFIDRIDLVIPLTKGAIDHLKHRIKQNTIIMGEKEIIAKSEKDYQGKIIDLDFSELAKEIGSKIYSNIIAAGVLTKLFDIDITLMKDYLSQRFEDKGKEVLENNYQAADKGFELGSQLISANKVSFSLEKDPKATKMVINNGATTVGIGALAGGCNFICSYPMSPSTGVLSFLADAREHFDVIVEQAEDEIAAINAGLGASYAGGRALVTTSGGGLALMSEGISLAGVSETPLVIHLAQRPGPATGLPTRTLQGDLELALYSGHGYFPRILLAPGTLEEAFYLTQKAFNLAAKYQVPVIVLTDQYFVDSYYTCNPPDVSSVTIEPHIEKNPRKNYQRYAFTETGISPRGIPGASETIIRADSHVHDQDGFICEDLQENRPKMVKKQKKKLAYITQEALPPELIGPKNYETLLISWGSTYNIINEAIANLENQKIALLHFPQLYPLHHKTKDYLEKAKKIIVIENNTKGQFANLLELTYKISLPKRILKSNGLPFSVEEIQQQIVKKMEGTQ